MFGEELDRKLTDIYIPFSKTEKSLKEKKKLKKLSLTKQGHSTFEILEGRKLNKVMKIWKIPLLVYKIWSNFLHGPNTDSNLLSLISVLKCHTVTLPTELFVHIISNIILNNTLVCKITKLGLCEISLRLAVDDFLLGYIEN